MAYAPNSAAKNLRTLRTGKLLVTVPDISNPFFSLILQGIEDAAQREGHAVLLGDTQHDEKREERYALMLQRKEADGLIFLGHRLPKTAGDLVRSMAPACAPVVNGCEFNPRLRIPSVHIDNAAAAAEAMDHLYALGHRPHRHRDRPAGQPAQPRSPAGSDDARASGRSRAGFRHHARRLLNRVRRDRGRASASRGTSGRPPCSASTMKWRSACSKSRDVRGFACPDDLSVVGFDDIRFSRHMDPPLTTIAQPMREIGEGTVRLLLDILSGKTDRADVGHAAAQTGRPRQHAPRGQSRRAELHWGSHSKA